MKKIVSGITATGKLTIGNYLGSIKQFIDFQNKYEQFLLIADLHGITVPFDPAHLHENSKGIAVLLMASGMNDKNTHIFFQNQIPEHAELAYILLCHTTIGELQRMIQYKDKSQKFRLKNNTVQIPSGILFYPALMAADILLYGANVVPVGEDQLQHLELTRNIAIRMNNKYGEIFTIPEIHLDQETKKIKALDDASKKMSKSSLNKDSYILLLDSKKDIEDKIKKAKTDSENKISFMPSRKPEISNLISIYSGFSNMKISEVVCKFELENYGVFKKALSNLLFTKLNQIQENYHKLKSNENWKSIITNDYKKVKKIASTKMDYLKHKIGFLSQF